MAKTYLGIDIGYDSLKLALVSGRRVKKTAVVSMPVSLVKEGRVVSPETMGELIRKTVKEKGIGAHPAAVAFPIEAVFIRNVTLPMMSAEQLVTNLPYEFRDYISDELKNYVFDYAMISGQAASESAESVGEDPDKSMDMIAVAAPVTLITETREYLRKAGMNLAVAAPALCAYSNIIRARKDASPTIEYCILDLGFHAIRMYMFRGDNHIVTRILEVGLSSLDDVIAEQFNVDVHLAHTYLLTDYEGCQEGERCMAAYDNIAVELLRAINFYRFSNHESELSDVYLCGGGSAIGALSKAIENSLGMQIHRASELIEGGESIENCDSLVQAIGIAMS